MNALTSLLTSQPVWLKAVSIILGTFILEDVATILAALAAQSQQLPYSIALIALYFGVAAGDIGLYALGWLGAQYPFFKRFLTLPKQQRTQGWFQQNTIKIVLISRFVPGARLPLYTACGFFKAPFLHFTLTAIGATLIWTTMLFLLSLHIGAWLLSHAQTWRWVGICGFIVCIIAIGRLIARFQRIS